MNYDSIEVPAYIGGDWGIYGLHLPGAFRSWERIRSPKKMIMAPPAYLERPVYQLQYKSLRWFDHSLKGIETGIIQEPPIRAYVMGTHQWKHAEEWPLPQTKWIPFNLHEGGLLWEHEHFAHGGVGARLPTLPTVAAMSPCATPELVEDTKVIGPAVLNLYASTSDSEVLWFVSLREVGP